MENNNVKLLSYSIVQHDMIIDVNIRLSKAIECSGTPCPHKEKYITSDADGGAYCNACDTVLS